MSVFGLGIAKINRLQPEVAEDILSEFENVFKDELGEYKYGMVHLELEEGAKPIYFKPRPLPFTLKKEIDKELDRLESIGAIIPVEMSEWGTPLVPKIKKDGSVRICADYKVTLNKYLKIVKYPLPRIEDIFAKLDGGIEFTKLDMSQAYNQLKLDDESKKITTWSTHRGFYQLNRLPYGIAPAAAKFQRMIEKILQGLEGVTSFLDDILVTGRNREEHCDRLRAVLSRLDRAGLKLNKKKCQLFKDKIKYLGYIIDKSGLHKDMGKVEAIISAVAPSNVGEVRSLIGMINYYNRFLPNLATIIKPLHKLLEKGKEFKWTEDCNNAFKEVKDILCKDEILAHYNPELDLKLYCDASTVGVGAALMQIDEQGEEKAIAYAARTLSKSEGNYSMIEKEALAIYYGVKHFHQYLYGREFILATDHKPLTVIFGEHKGIPQMVAGRLQRWALFLAGYQYRIEYIKGKYNHSADFLSRTAREGDRLGKPDEGSYIHFIELCKETPIDSKAIKLETSRDPELSRIKEYTERGWPEKVNEEFKVYRSHKDELTVENGCVLWGYRIVIPGKLREDLLKELHAAHSGMVKTKQLARQFMWWPGIDKQIEDMIKKCNSCIKMRPEPNKAVLIPWEKPDRMWERLHLDYLGPIKGKTYLIIIDAYSKWPEVLAVEQASAEQTILKAREVMARFGIPKQVVTDNGTQFTAEIFEKFLRKNGIRHTFTAPGHPATNGQAENGVKSFKTGLYKALDDKNNCGVHIQTIMARYLMMYRNMKHCTTQETPAKLMLGRELRVRLTMIKPSDQDRVINAQNNQKKNFRGKRDIVFKKGDEVVIRDYRQVNKKSWLQAEIEEIIGPRTYICRLKDGRKWRRHLDQIYKGGSMIEEEQESYRESLETESGDGNKEEDKGNAVVEPKMPELMGAVRRSERKSKPPDRLIETIGN